MSDSASLKRSTAALPLPSANERSEKRRRNRLAPANCAPRSWSEKLMSKPITVAPSSVSFSIRPAITRRSQGKRPYLAIAASSTAATTTRPLVGTLPRWWNCTSFSACSSLVSTGISPRPASCQTYTSAKQSPVARPMRKAVSFLTQRSTLFMADEPPVAGYQSNGRVRPYNDARRATIFP